MARVTVEDCITIVPNRFDLVLFAAKRAREISSGAPLTIMRDNDKNPVVALREIADQTLSIDNIQTNLVKEMQRYSISNDSEEEMDNIIIEEGFLPSDHMTGSLGGDLEEDDEDMDADEDFGQMIDDLPQELEE